MTEFGIFNDEGCIESGFYSREEAEKVAVDTYSEEDDVRVAAICPDHEEQEADTCEECNSDDWDEDDWDEDEDEDEEDDEG